ncbi:hypothetical protein ACN28G_14745 [Micromonospora sp. WMMA1923]|uniref:hypothetical protein n=1 Tax=Micromonospora sp. WMMA1923 TaxID=3404125 RepID=UPI003B960627
MADGQLASVIPPVALPGQRAGTRSSGGRALQRPPLPLSVVPPERVGRLVYGMAAVDASGRIGDRMMNGVLGWSAGTRLQAAEGGGMIVVRAARCGSFAVTAGGHLHLPAALRHWCGLRSGDRVLLAADPVDGLLVVHPPVVLDTVLAEVHAAVLGGDRR